MLDTFDRMMGEQEILFTSTLMLLLITNKAHRAAAGLFGNHSVGECGYPVLERRLMDRYIIDLDVHDALLFLFIKVEGEHVSCFQAKPRKILA